MRISKTVRNSGISVGVLLVVLIAGGTAYTLFGDGQAPKQASSTKAVAEETFQPIPKPPQPAANAPEGVAVGAFTTPVAPGSNSSIQVHTNAGSTCNISVVYNNAPSTDSGLAPKTADEYGVVSWSWTVGSSVPVGSWPVRVTCAYHGRTGVVQANLEVSRTAPAQ